MKKYKKGNSITSPLVKHLLLSLKSKQNYYILHLPSEKYKNMRNNTKPAFFKTIQNAPLNITSVKIQINIDNIINKTYTTKRGMFNNDNQFPNMTVHV